jgi:hypothetical protein
LSSSHPFSLVFSRATFDRRTRRVSSLLSGDLQHADSSTWLCSVVFSVRANLPYGLRESLPSGGFWLHAAGGLTRPFSGNHARKTLTVIPTDLEVEAKMSSSVIRDLSQLAGYRHRHSPHLDPDACGAEAAFQTGARPDHGAVESQLDHNQQL